MSLALSLRLRREHRSLLECVAGVEPVLGRLEAGGEPGAALYALAGFHRRVSALFPAHLHAEADAAGGRDAARAAELTGEVEQIDRCLSCLRTALSAWRSGGGTAAEAALRGRHLLTRIRSHVSAEDPGGSRPTTIASPARQPSGEAR